MDPTVEDRHLAKDWGSDHLLEEEGFIRMIRKNFPQLIACAAFSWGGAPQFSDCERKCTIRVDVITGEGGSVSYIFEQVRVPDGAYKDCWMTNRVVRI